MRADPPHWLLVTGGAGFIGSHIVDALVERGEAVRVLDDFSSGLPENLDEARARARRVGAPLEIIEGSVCDGEGVAVAARGARAIFHEAAIASVPRSVADPMASHDVNVLGTLRLLLAARDAGVSRFVFASSCAIYGEGSELPKVESMAPQPISPYAADKQAAEAYVLLFHRLYGLPTIALRYFNVVGSRQDPASDYAAVVPRFASALLQGKRPVIFGDGGQTRDFNPVANVVEANLRALDAPASACGRTYNIAKGESITLLELVRRMAALASVQVTPEHAPTRPGDIRHSSADITAARAQLEYRGHANLDEGLRQAIAFYGEPGRKAKRP